MRESILMCGKEKGYCILRGRRYWRKDKELPVYGNTQRYCKNKLIL